MEEKKQKTTRIPSIDTISPFSIDALTKSIRRSSRCCLQPNDIIVSVTPTIASQQQGNDLLTLIQHYCKREQYELRLESLGDTFAANKDGKCVVAISEHMLLHPRAAPIHVMINPDYLHVSIKPTVYCYGADEFNSDIYDSSIVVVPGYIAGVLGRSSSIEIRSITSFAFDTRPPVMFLQEDWNLYPDTCRSFADVKKYALFKNLSMLSKEDRASVITSHLELIDNG